MAVRITPFIRIGTLIEFKPKSPTVKQAGFLLQQLATSFADICNEYREVVASAVGANLKDTHFKYNEQVRLRREWDTYIIDYPLLHVSNSGIAFNTRLCTAICTHERTTKTWSRIGQPLNNAGIRSNMPIEELQDVIPKYYTVITSSLHWINEIFKDSITEYLSDYDIAEKGQLEVSSYGVNDQSLATYFNELCETNISMREILRDKSAEEKFSSYFKTITSFSNGNHGFDISGDPKKLDWYTSRVMVQVKERYIKPREVLFLRYSVDEDSMCMGLGYDDSITRDLSHEAVRNVSKLLASRV